MKTRLDDAVEVLTGDREALWMKQHGGAVPMREAALKPMEQPVLHSGIFRQDPALPHQLGDFVIEQGALRDRVIEAWELFDRFSSADVAQSHRLRHTPNEKPFTSAA